MGMMPLCLLIYTKMWTDADAIILPYDSIGESSETALSLLSILPSVTTISLYHCPVVRKLPQIFLNIP